jgi:YidC/Oxa1 family membrane protein insertase
LLGAALGARRPLSGAAAAPPPAPAAGSAADAVAVALEAAGALSDPVRSSLGFGPIESLTRALDFLHVEQALPWWGSIVAMTVVFRLVVLPLNIKQMTNALRMQKLQPEMMALQAEMKLSMPAPGSAEQAQYGVRMQDLQRKHGVNVFGTLLGPLAQIPIFLTMFWTLRHMAEAYPSFHHGGVLWFPDLAVPDATYGLPILTSLSFLAMVELGADSGPQSSDERARNIKLFMRVMALAMVPITVSMPSAVAMYWLTTNTFGILQTLFFKVPGVKPLLGIRLAEAPQAQVEAEAQAEAQADLGAPKVYFGRPPSSPADEAATKLKRMELRKAARGT